MIKKTQTGFGTLAFLTFLMVTGSMFVFVFAAYSSYESRQAIEKNVEAETQNLTTTLYYTLSEKIKRIDFALSNAQHEFERELRAGGIDATELDDYLLSRQEALAELDGMRMTDANGFIKYNIPANTSAIPNLADRDYFKNLARPDSSSDQIMVGKAVRSAITGKWVLPVAKRLNSPDGSFAGIVYATILIDELTRELSNLRINQKDTLLIRDDQLRLITRFPAIDGDGGRIGDARASAELTALVATGRTSGNYFAKQTADAVPRMYSFRKLESAPWLVIVGKSQEEFLAGWYAQVTRYMSFAGLFILVSVLSFRQLHRNWREQQAVWKQLEQTTQTLETVTDLSSDWVYWRSSDKTLFHYNSPSCMSVTGYTNVEFLEHPGLIEKIIHPEDKVRWNAHTEGVDKHTSEEYRIIAKDGSIRWISHTCTLVHDKAGMACGRRGSNIDVTGKKIAAAELEASEKRFSEIFNSSPVATLMYDEMTGCIVDANDSFLELFREKREAILGSQASKWALCSHPDTAQALPAPPFRNWETAYPMAGDQTVSILISTAVLALQNRKFVLVVYQDITEQKCAEQNAIEAMKTAQAANEAKSRFLAIVSHELRTPMNGILGMSQMLMMKDVSEAERIDFGRTIHNAGETLLSLLNDVLDHSKIEAGKLELDPQPFDILHVLEEVTALFVDSASQKGLTLNARIPAISKRYVGDSGRIRQILMNLLNNAVKFTEHGTVVLDFKDIDSSLDGPHRLRFSVRDTGIGIPDDEIQKLFSPFQQVDASSTRRFGGTGLGLAISRNLVHLMKGNIGLESTVGEGSEFWFEIPCHLLAHDTECRSEMRDTNLHGMEMENPAVPRRILVVEDNPTNYKVIVALLKKLGVSEILLAKHGGEAVEMVTADAELDLVFMDCEMPVMDGIEATQAIRRWEASHSAPALKIVALTANAFAEDRIRCLGAGMDDFLSKPVSVNGIREIFERHYRVKIDGARPALPTSA